MPKHYLDKVHRSCAHNIDASIGAIVKRLVQYSSIILAVLVSVAAVADYLALSKGSATYAGRQDATEGTVSADGIQSEIGSITILPERSQLTPLAETWTTIDPSTAERPTERHETGFVRAGNLFYLLGGRGTDPVDVYDPVAQSWSSRSQIPTEMHHFQAVEMDGLVYVIGAFEGGCCNESPHPIVYIYDPYDDEWIDGPVIPESRRRGSAGLVAYDSKFYLVSGLEVGHQSGWVPWTDMYDPATNTWQELPDAPRSRDHFHAGIVDSKIVAAGGRNSGRNGIFSYTIAEVDIYDIATSEWSTATNNIPTERAGTTAASLGDEVLIIGGEAGRNEAYSETEAFNVLTEAWRTVGSLQRERHGTQAIVSNGAIYVASGSGSRGGSPELDSIEAFNYSAPVSSPGDPLDESSLVSANSTISFGNVVVDEEPTNTITLNNRDGNQAIVITSIQLNGDSTFAFTYPHTLPVVIAPNTSTTIPVGFSPAEAKLYSGSIVIEHSGADGETSVALTGSGVTEPLPNQPPVVVAPIDDRTVDEDSDSFSIDLSQVFSDPDQAATTLSYSISKPSFPAIIITAQAGSTLLITPLPNANGSIPITVQAQDEEGLSASTEFMISISPINDPPFLAHTKGITVVEGTTEFVSVAAEDPDSDLLSLTVKISPNMDIATFKEGKDNSGELTVRPGFDDAGLHTVIITATDPGQLSATSQFTILVVDRNTVPIISPLPLVEMDANSQKIGTVVGLDQDGDPVTITGVNLPDFVSLGSTATTEDEKYMAEYTISPTSDDVGTYQGQIRAVDPSGQYTETLLSITVNAVDVPNQPPVMSRLDDITVTAGIPFTLTLAATDPNPEDMLSLSTSNALDGMSFNSAISESAQTHIVFDGTTSEGEHTITVRVSDQDGLFIEETFVLTVKPASTMLPPQPAGTEAAEVSVGEILSFTVRFVDPNADQVTLSAVELPSGASFTDMGNGTGILTWLPSEVEQVGQHSALISATDSTGLTTEQTYDITVMAPTTSETRFRYYLPVK